MAASQPRGSTQRDFLRTVDRRGAGDGGVWRTAQRQRAAALLLGGERVVEATANMIQPSINGQQTAGEPPFARDPHRPVYHFLPPANWLNDPNGVVQWNGQYHLFYQYNPAGPFHGTIHWGHAVSPDLVHWTHLPIALAPTPGGPDADGCWSGCFVNNNGTPTLIYTGVRRTTDAYIQRPCLATSTDDLITWEKYAQNPIIEESPPGLDVLGFRDHCVWRENDVWYQIIGTGITDVGGAALLYRSNDLIVWDYVQPLYIGDHRKRDPFWTGHIWECPDLFPLGDKQVLVVSVWGDRQLHYCVFYVGGVADHAFTPEHVRRLDPGPSFYAPQSMQDAAGRRIMWGWLREGRDIDAQRVAGWSGVMSLPRVLQLRSDGTVGLTPAPELAMLRDTHQQITNLDLASSPSLLDISGDTLEIVAAFDAGSAAAFGIDVRFAPDGSESTRIVYDRATGQVQIDTRRSSSDRSVLHRDVYSAPCPLDGGDRLRLHLFLDRSVIEVFANEVVGSAFRVYPTRSDSDGIRVFADGGAARLVSLDAWTLRSIWQVEL